MSQPYQFQNGRHNGRAGLDIGAIMACVRQDMRAAIGDGEYKSYIDTLIPACEWESKILIVTKTKYAKTWIETNALPVLRGAWLSHDPQERDIVIHAFSELPDHIRGLLDERQQRAPEAQSHAEPISDDMKSAGSLSPSAFANIARGDSNSVALNVAQRIATWDPIARGVICLLGANGVGKTQMLRAIEADARARRPRAKVAYVSANDFIAQFSGAARSRDFSRFNDLAKNADLLLFDDVHLLAEAPGSQKELLRIIKELGNDSRCLVIASAEPIEELRFAETNLPRTLAASLKCEIRAPDPALRAEIVRVKWAENNLTDTFLALDSDVVDLIVKAAPATGRDIEGAVRTLYVNSVMIGKAPSFELCQELFHRALTRQLAPARIETVLTIVAKQFDLPHADLIGPRRTKNLVQARHVAIWLARTLSGRSFPMIGSKFGGRDHTTVMHAFSKIDAERASDAALQNLLHLLETKIRQQTDIDSTR
ncbi:MAG TPA: hypothetical protein DCZ49_01600 [Hyphomonadaceae bacterium]|nr:hypothetical protein [Hyphomonadaceae bacterium]